MITNGIQFEDTEGGIISMAFYDVVRLAVREEKIDSSAEDSPLVTNVYVRYAQGWADVYGVSKATAVDILNAYKSQWE